MPYCKLKSNLKSIEHDAELVKDLSSFVSDLLNKSEKFVLIEVLYSPLMHFQNSADPLCFIELKSIELPEDRTNEFSNKICAFIKERLQIEAERIYIEFSNVERHMWAWNHKTFVK